MAANDTYAFAAAVTQDLQDFGYVAGGSLVFRQELEYASLFSRFFAALIDGIITSIISVPIFVGIIVLNPALAFDPSEALASGIPLLIVITLFAVAYLYYVIQETSTAQATLGKRMMGIKVATLTGEPIGIVSSTARFMAKMVPSINPLIGLVCLLGDLFCLVVSSKKRMGHDLIASTVVISN